MMSVPLSRGGRYFVGGALVVSLTWLFAFSDPLPSYGWEALAGAATLVLVIAGVVGVAGRPLAPGSRRRIPLLPTAVAIVIAVATAGLCTTRAPMLLRFYQARPALLVLAAQAQRGGGGHRALAGTYYLHTFGRRDYAVRVVDHSGPGPGGPGSSGSSGPARPRGYYYVFQTDDGEGWLFSDTEAGYVYSPLGDPNVLDQQNGVDDNRYTHLTGPWWTYTLTVLS